MEELNNWDNDTIEEILEVARTYAFQANIEATRLMQATQDRGINETEKWTRLKEASRHYGQEQAYNLIISKCEQLQQDNAEAIEAHQPS